MNMEVVSAEVPAPVPTGGETVPETGNTPEVATPTETPPAEERHFTQKEVDDLIGRRLAKAERRFSRQMQEVLATARPQTAPAAPAAKEGADAPDPSKYSDYSEYIRDLAAYSARQELSNARTAAAKAAETRQVEEHFLSIQERVQQHFTQGPQKYADFDAVVYDDDLSITPTMAEVIAESEVGMELAYWLGKNPEEAAKIARMRPAQAARAMALQEAKLATPAPAPTSKAPTPITPVGGKSVIEKDPSQMTDAEFNAWRRKQIAARNGR